MRVAVVGHVEWTTLAVVDRVPDSGGIVHADVVWEGPAGGGAVAAGQLAKLAGTCTFFTAIGGDHNGSRASAELERLGVRVEAATRTLPTRTAVSLIDATGERTTTTLGLRLEPSANDPLPWHELDSFDGVYFVAGDTAVLREARRGRVLVATSRELPTVIQSAVAVDVLVGSARDPAERYDWTSLADTPRLMVRTDGARGGTFAIGGERSRGARGPRLCHYSAARPPGPVIDAYGIGDSFAAALTFALARGESATAALDLAALCGAACAAARGPFAGQLDSTSDGISPQ